MTAQMLPLTFLDADLDADLDVAVDAVLDAQRVIDPGPGRETDVALVAGTTASSSGVAAHAELADLLSGRSAATAPWNRDAHRTTTRTATRTSLAVPPRARHLHLVADAPAVVPVARRSRLRALFAGLGLAGLVALASVGVLAFLGADAAASTPASPTGATPSAVAPVATPIAVAEPAVPQWVVVQSGDSLWTLARRLQPKGDVRRLVDRLSERLGGASINAGQRIDVAGLVD